MQVIENSYAKTNAKSNANTNAYTNTKVITNANAKADARKKNKYKIEPINVGGPLLNLYFHGNSKKHDFNVRNSLT